MSVTERFALRLFGEAEAEGGLRGTGPPWRNKD
jgi:hypothetical protein